jgi:hypothetical protein
VRPDEDLRLDEPTTVEAAPDDDDDREPLVDSGDWVFVGLSTGDEVYGQLTAVFKGSGETDGLIQVRVSDDEPPTNIYERHIVTFRREAR